MSLTASRAPGRLPDLPDRGLQSAGRGQPLAHIVQQRALPVIERQPGFDPVKVGARYFALLSGTDEPRQRVTRTLGLEFGDDGFLVQQPANLVFGHRLDATRGCEDLARTRHLRKLAGSPAFLGEQQSHPRKTLLQIAVLERVENLAHGRNLMRIKLEVASDFRAC